MNIDANAVWEIIRDSSRFVSPFSEPSGYYLVTNDDSKTFSDAEIGEYLRKLEYMAKNIDALLQQAFDPSFYEFYGVNRSRISSSAEMCERLTVDSFVFNISDRTISCCLTNPQFMSGHYIECVWNGTWELLSAEIC